MTNKLEKILTIEQQIEKLKERQKKIEEQMHIGIGREVLKLWNVESEEEAIKWVQKMAPKVNDVGNVASSGMNTNES